MVFSEQATYVGEFRHNLDAKGRLTIPSKWRFQGDEADVYLALPNPSGFISVYPPSRIRLLEEKIRNISLSDMEGQAVVTAFMSMAHRFGCDRAGRINLNDKLIAHAGIEKEAVLLGALSSFNIYSPETYARMVPKSTDASLELFKKFDL